MKGITIKVCESTPGTPPGIATMNKSIMKRLGLKDGDFIQINNSEITAIKIVMVSSSEDESRCIHLSERMRHYFSVGVGDEIKIKPAETPKEAEEVVIAHSIEGLKLNFSPEMSNKVVRNRAVYKGEKMNISFPTSKDIPSLFSDIIKNIKKSPLEEELPRIEKINFFVMKTKPTGVVRITKNTKVLFKYDKTADASIFIYEKWTSFPSVGSIISRLATGKWRPYLKLNDLYVDLHPSFNDVRTSNLLSALNAIGIINVRDIDENEREYYISKMKWKKIAKESLNVIEQKCKDEYVTSVLSTATFDERTSDEEDPDDVIEKTELNATKSFDEMTKETRKKLRSLEKDEVFLELLKSYFVMNYYSRGCVYDSFEKIICNFLDDICDSKIKKFKNSKFQRVYNVLRGYCRFVPKAKDKRTLLKEFFTKGLRTTADKYGLLIQKEVRL